MNRLIEHIERLLLLHDCVIIPDFGGFVLRSISASYNAETNMFFPPRKEVVFNQTLDHNDGLLMESYMKAYETDFDSAQQLVKDDVTSLKNTLEKEGELQLNTVGFFVKDEERLVFMAGKNSDLLFGTSSFGLPVFHFLPLQNRKPSLTGAPVLIEPVAVQQTVEENPKKPKPENIFYKIPVTKTFVRTAVAAAAAILLFLFVSTPVKDVNGESYRASFIPQELIPKKTADDVINEAFTKVENQETSPKEENLKSQEEDSEGGNKDVALVENTAKPAVATPAETKKTETKAPATKAPAAKSTAANSPAKNYYVIIGSFDSKTQANNFIKSLKGQEAKTAGIIVKDGRVRVYAQGFVTEKSANSYMNKLRQTTKHKQAWTYRVEN
jgi:cell division septation protein DedD